MSTALTNTTASQALKGQDAIVTLSASSALTNIPNLFLGQRASVQTSGDVGFVSWIDSPYGLEFKVKPQYPSGYFCSSVNSKHIGILSAYEVVTVYPSGQ